MAKKNLSQIAKKPIATQKLVQPVLDVVKEVVIIKQIDKGVDRKLSDEERDLKAKKVIDSLLLDVELPEIGKKTIIKVEEEVIEDVPDTEDENDWFNEQILQLNQIIDNQKIEIERLNLMGGSYGGNGDNSGYEAQAVQGAIELFIEIQNVYDNLKRANGELIIYPLQFLDKMTSFFPFLQQYRRQLIGEM